MSLPRSILDVRLGIDPLLSLFVPVLVESMDLFRLLAMTLELTSRIL